MYFPVPESDGQEGYRQKQTEYSITYKYTIYYNQYLYIHKFMKELRTVTDYLPTVTTGTSRTSYRINDD